MNCYAPNKEKEKKLFPLKVTNALKTINYSVSDCILAAGDWNTIFSPDIDIKGGSRNCTNIASDEFMTFLNEYDLIDIWQMKNSLLERFTYRQKRPLIQTRLDYFLVNNYFQELVINTDIISSPWSDHSGITLEIKHLPLNEKGRGTWKFNNSFLEDQQFVSDLKRNIRKWKRDYQGINDKRVIWELFKFEIRHFCIEFGKQKCKKQKDNVARLNDKLKRLETNLNSETFLEYDQVKQEIKNIEDYFAKGVIIRSKVQFFEEDEKCTKYFFDLEKVNYKRKHIRKLKIDEKRCVTDPKLILHEEREYYKKLYQETINDDTIKGNTFLLQDMPKISPLEKQLCDEPITLNELYNSLKTFGKNKSPGNDGLTAEFFILFWDDMGILLLESLSESFIKEELSTSQRQAIITLIDKKGKDRQYLKNWRPISLINVDYKILTKALSFRLKKCLASIIHQNQTGFVEGRKIFDSIRTIQDVFEYTKLKDIEGMLIFIDFEKAFDSINWTFMNLALEKLNFGLSFTKWVKILYTNISSCIINNGITSPYFDLSKGVRQGDPLSPYLFIIAKEFLAQTIRQSADVKGIKLGQHEQKMTMYADDTTMFLSDTKSAKCLFKIIHEFTKVSGLSINIEKTEGVWLGKNRNSKDTPFGIKWTKNPVKALGIYFSNNTKDSEQINFEDKIKKLERQLHWWKARGLTLQGRILITKTIGLSKFSFLANILHIPKDIISKVNQLIYKFIWKGKIDKVKRDIMIQSYENGGLKVDDFNLVVESTKITWIKSFLYGPDTDWKSSFAVFLNVKNPQLFLQANLELKQIPNDLPQYYKDILKAWINIRNISQDNNVNLKQIIWYNKNVKIGDKSVYNERLLLAGLWTTSDLYENGRLIPFIEWKKRGAIAKDFLIWRGLLQTIPREVKRAAAALSQDQKDENSYNKIKIGNVYKELKKISQRDIKDVIRNQKLLTNVIKSIDKFNFKISNISDQEWKNSFSFPHEIKIDNKIREMQFKILHRIIGVNKFLYKINKVDSPRCDFCQLNEESIEHLFYECHKVKTFWMQVETLMRIENLVSDKLLLKDFLLGFNVTDPLKKSAANSIILHGKRFIFTCKKEPGNLSLHQFKETILKYYHPFTCNNNTNKLLLYEKQVIKFSGLLCI